MPNSSFVADHPTLLKWKRRAISLIQKTLRRRGLVLVSEMAHLHRERSFDISDRMDFVRLACLELFAHEAKVNGIGGDVAEVGVYRGDFAEKIHEAFPDRIHAIKASIWKRDFMITMKIFQGPRFRPYSVAYETRKWRVSIADVFQTRYWMGRERSRFQDLSPL
jgi:hypothetical protein